MGTIKDIIDLIIQLQGRVKDRKLAADISHIQTLISTVQAENASAISENFELKKENSECKDKLTLLEKEISGLKQKHSEEIAALQKTHGTDMEVLRKQHAAQIAALNIQESEDYNPLTFGLNVK
jgi:hypothetical protein